jgi:site-specific recombinase XerD
MTTTSTAIVVYDPELAGPEHVALAGFLGGYRGLTRDAYALDLRQFVAFCDERHLGLFEVRRSDIEAYGRELEARGLRKGGKTVTIPLAPRTARAVDLAIGERDSGPIFVTADGRRLDRRGASRIVRRVARRAGITKPIGPHTLRHAFITAALDAGVPLRDVQEAASHADPRTTMRYDRARVSLDRHATYIVSTYIAGAAR